MEDPRAKILLVDDDPAILNQLKWGLAALYEVVTAQTPDEAMAALQREKPELVTLDLAVASNDPESGFQLLDRFLSHDPSLKVVMITGNEDRENAIRAVNQGAFDFFRKPVDLEELRMLLRRAEALRHLEQENATLRARLREEGSLGRMLGRSDAIHGVFSMIRKVAPADVTVLITGDSGTGKELVARELHRHSGRSEAPFVSISCGAIPESLLESELFGHEKGAFTSAHASREGKLEMAAGGTVFLDEIGEMPMSLQVKILRFLQEREIERVGGRKVIPLDVRVLAATNRDLRGEVAKGTFREDLYFRLSVVNIHLPPLRERREDVVYLAQQFLERYGTEFHRGRLTFSRDALRALQRHPWQGNVRELEHRVQRAVVLSSGRVVRAEDLELTSEDNGGLLPLREAREVAERRVVLEALRRSCGNIARAAKDLEISRPTLHDLLRKLSIQAADYKDGMGPDKEDG
jgi:two-component system NtrC family response regulator